MKTVLLIEDDPDVLANTAELLEDEGFLTIRTTSGTEALELVRTRAPDLVLCDVFMPEMDGYDVLRTLGHDPATAGIPFIFLSAKAEPSDVRKGMDLGADDYLTKPFTARQLLDSVEARLKRSAVFRRKFPEGIQGLNEFMDQARRVAGLKDLGILENTRQLEPGQVLFREGDEMTDVPFLVKGKMRTFRVNRDRKEFTTGLYGPGEFIGYMGLLDGGLATETAEALEPCEAAFIPHEEWSALLYRDRDVSACFIRMLAHDIKDREAHLLQLAYASVRQRLAQALLRLQARYAPEHERTLGLAVSREHLASIVGTATESLIRNLADLKNEGLIEVHGREISILQREKLVKLAHI